MDLQGQSHYWSTRWGLAYADYLVLAVPAQIGIVVGGDTTVNQGRLEKTSGL